MSGNTDGLLVYDSVHHRYAFRKNLLWMYLNPWDTEGVDPAGDQSDINYITTPYDVGIGITTAPSSALEVNGDVIADHFDGYGVVPLGGIIMWSGSEASIPTNYQLCDGTSRNGYTTPNLVGKFVVGARSGSTGGGSNNLSTTEISYQHTSQYTINTTNCNTYEYEYTVRVKNTCFGPYLPYTVEASSCADAKNKTRSELGDPGAGCDYVFEPDCTTSANPNYYRNNPDCFNSEVRIVDVVTGSDNRPVYYRLAYIMRVE